MIVPLPVVPTTPTPAADAPEALGDFAAALAETELAVLHALMGDVDGELDVTAETPETQTSEETPASLVTGADPILPPLATTEQALSQSWVQHVAGPSAPETPVEPVVDTTAGPIGDPTVDHTSASPLIDLTTADVADAPTADANPEVPGSGADQLAASTVSTEPVTATAVTPLQVDADPLTGATERDYGTALTELEASARPVEVPVSEAVPTAAPLDSSPSDLPIDPTLTSDDNTAAAEISTTDPAQAEGPAPAQTPAEQIDAIDPSELVDPTDVVTDVAPPTRPAPADPLTRPVIESATLQRVEAAIEQLENTPPPRTLVLDLDDEHGTRVRVSSTADGVQVDVQSGDRDDAQAAWEQDLREQLAERGFELLAEAGTQTDDTADVAASTATRPADDALRI